MSKLAKGLAITTLAAGMAVVTGISPVSAGGYDYKKDFDFKVPSYHGKDYDGHKGKDKGWGHYGGYFNSNNVSFHEDYDKTSKLFYNLKQDEKKHSNEHYSANNFDYHDGDHGKKYGKHGKGHYGGWGGYGNFVSVNYDRDDSYYKSFEETKKLKERESYSKHFDSNNVNADHGKWGKGGSYAANSVSASLNHEKEYELDSSVKAVAAQNSSVSTDYTSGNYGPHGGSYNSVSAYEDLNKYSKLEANVSEYAKEKESVNYSASNVNADLGKWGHGGDYAASNVNYDASKSYEASKEVTLVAEESASYSTGFNAQNSSWKH